MQKLLIVSTVAAANDIRPKPLKITWKRLAQKFSQVKPRGEYKLAEYLALPRTERSAQKNGPGWIPGKFKEGKKRLDDNLEKLYCFTGDCDNNKSGVPITLNMLRRVLDGFDFVIHSTYSHSPKKSKWRFVVPLSRPVQREEYDRLFDHFNQLLSGGLDPKGRTPSQLYFWPSCPPDAVKHFQYVLGEGEPFDPSVAIAVTPKTKTKLKDITLPKVLPSVDLATLKLPRSTRALIETGVSTKRNFTSRSEALFSCVLALLSHNLSDAQIASIILNPKHKISEKSLEQKEPRKYAARTIMKARAWRAVPDDATLDQLITEMNRQHAVVMVGGKCMILTETEDPILNRRDVLLSVEHDLRLKYANRRITVREKSVDLASLWLQHPARRQYDRIIFSPQQDAPDCYNLWRGFAVEPAAGDCSLYLTHILDNVAQGDKLIYKYILAFMADAVQNPGRLPGVALVMRGDEGTGKGTLATEFGKLFGQHFIQVSHSRHLIGNFNAHLKDALVVYADEAFWAGDKSSEGVLKAMITEEYRVIESKGKDAIMVANNLRTIISSNHDWVVPAGPMARRFFMVDVGEARRQDTKYFTAIKQQMDNGGREALLHYLLHYDLTGIDLRKFPRTEALLDQQMMTMDLEESFWLDRLKRGEVVNRSGRWPDHVKCSTLFDQYLQFATQAGANRRRTETLLGLKIKKFCPEIEHERFRVDGKRTYVFVLPSLKRCRELYSQRVNTEINWNK